MYKIFVTNSSVCRMFFIAGLWSFAVLIERNTCVCVCVCRWLLIICYCINCIVFIHVLIISYT